MRRRLNHDTGLDDDEERMRDDDDHNECDEYCECDDDEYGEIKITQRKK